MTQTDSIIGNSIGKSPWRTRLRSALGLFAIAILAVLVDGAFSPMQASACSKAQLQQCNQACTARGLCSSDCDVWQGQCTCSCNVCQVATSGDGGGGDYGNVDPDDPDTHPSDDAE
jgi:hypothetical protein